MINRKLGKGIYVEQLKEAEKKMRQDEKYQYGIAAMRVFITFIVICCHGWDSSLSSKILMPLDLMKPLAVPLFMEITFFFMFQKRGDGSLDFFWNRWKRVAIPYFTWPVIFMLIYQLLGLKTSIAVVASWKELPIQYLLGSSNIIHYFWFLNIWMLLMLLFFILFRFFTEKQVLLIMSVLSVMALIWEYTGWNMRMIEQFVWGDHLQNHILMIPFATCGCFFAFAKRKNRIPKKSWQSVIMLCLLAVLIFFLQSRKILPTLEAEPYAGVPLILMSVCLFAATLLLPTTWMPEWLQRGLKRMSGYTMGIYCMHGLILFLLQNLCRQLRLQEKAFGVNVVCFCICYLLCRLLAKLPFGIVKKLIQ